MTRAACLWALAAIAGSGCLSQEMSVAPEAASHASSGPGLGAAIAEADLADWDRDVSPDGAGLPPGGH